ncbi:hypothetical protein D3C80_665080 [compost metagenome]
MAARLSGFSFHGHIFRDAEKASLTGTDTLHYCCALPRAIRLHNGAHYPGGLCGRRGFLCSLLGVILLSVSQQSNATGGLRSPDFLGGQSGFPSVRED